MTSRNSDPLRRLVKGLPLAYLFHSVNLAVGILMVPLLLTFLDVAQYVQWMLFTTLAGVTLQIEASLQMLGVRQIARAYHASQQSAVERACAATRLTYRWLAVATLLPFAIFGALFLRYVSDQPLSDTWLVEWSVFVAAYAINYFVGTNNNILLAMEKTNFYFAIMSLTRAANFIGAMIFLFYGAGILGICIAFFASVITGCMAITLRARRAMADYKTTPERVMDTADDVDTLPFRPRDALLYMLFTVAAFAIYRGSALIAASVFDSTTVGSYTLALMAYAMTTAVCLVPTQVWLAHFVRAIMSNNTDEIIRELARVAMAANFAFLAAMLLLVTVAPGLLALIGSSVELPPVSHLVGLGAAFALEMNLFLFVNMLVIKRDFRFVRRYVLSVVCAVTIGIGSVALGVDLIIGLVLLPMLVQLCIAAPGVFSYSATHLGLSRHALLARVYSARLALDRSAGNVP